MKSTMSRRGLVQFGSAYLAASLFHGEAFAVKEVPTKPSGSALLILDYQVGVGDQPYARSAALRAAAALAAGRKAGLPIVFSKVKFRPGYVDISASNKVFGAYKAKNLLPPDASQLIALFRPVPGEVVIDKDRFSAFSGNDLCELLRSAGINHLVIAGVATSHVVLSTYSTAADADYSMTILSDACADPKATLHSELMRNLFPASATVATVDEWTAGLRVAM